MMKLMVVTNTETGSPGAREMITPPTAATSAKTTDHRTALSGEEVICTAAAPGVISSASTSSAPTSWRDRRRASPTSTAKPREIQRTGTPLACAITGSALAKSIGRQYRTTTAITITATMASSQVEAEDTATIWPVSREKAVEELPG